jgi:hypothetical protein
MWSCDEKQTILSELARPSITQMRVAKYLHVNCRRIEKLLAAHKAKRKFSNSVGRRNRIDAISKSAISSAIMSARDEKSPLTKSNTIRLIQDEAVMTDKRRGETGLTSTIHPQTVAKILVNLNATVEKGQVMSNARHKEMKDIRNMVSMAVMNEAYAKFKPPQLIGNFDGTQFIMSGTNEELLVTIKGKTSTDNYDHLPLTIVQDSKLSQAVKWIMLGNANGNLSEDIFLISDTDMDENECEFHQITGLSHNTDPSSSGWLCIVKSRCGNLKFFTWYLNTIVVTFVNKCRSLLYDTIETDLNEAKRFYLVADGEDIQIQPLENDEVAKILEDNKIDLGKGPASCTNTIGNACDRSNLFKSTKKVNRHVNSSQKYDFEDLILEDKIFAILARFHSRIGNQKSRFISKGIVKIVKSLARVVNFQIVMHGFHRIGVYPLSAHQCLSNCDPTILKQYNAVDIENIVDKIPALSQLFLDETTGGQITEEQMDQAGIPSVASNDRRLAPKDKRTQNQQRAVMLSNQASRRRRKDWLQARKKRDDKDPNTATVESNGSSTITGSTRKRAPNRSKDVIEAEKRQKQMRRLSRESSTSQNKI